MLQTFDTFKEEIKKLDPDAFATDTVNACGEWLNFLCNRYGLPTSPIYTLDLPDACSVLLFACKVMRDNEGFGFRVISEPFCMRVSANKVIPHNLVGARLRVLAECGRTSVYFTEIVDIDSPAFGAHIFFRFGDLQPANKKVRRVQLDD